MIKFLVRCCKDNVFMAYTKVFQIKKNCICLINWQKSGHEKAFFSSEHVFARDFSILVNILNLLTTNNLNKHYIFPSCKNAFLTENSLENFLSNYLFHTVISVVLQWEKAKMTLQSRFFHISPPIFAFYKHGFPSKSFAVSLWKRSKSWPTFVVYLYPF